MAQAHAAATLLPPTFESMRPRQWVKNGFVFAALVFAGRLDDPYSVLLTVQAFAGFCLLSSGTYLVNDVADATEDRLHPTKRYRPVAAGRVGRGRAVMLAAICYVLGLALCLGAGGLNLLLATVGLSYVALSFIYTFWAKRRILVDVICIATGFVLRAVAGGVAIDVPVSRWLLACTFALCMFLGFGKRRCELAQGGEHGYSGFERGALGGYRLALLDQLLSVSGGVAIVTFLVYSILSAPSPLVFYSTPLVVFCVFRVALLVESGCVEGPEAAVTRDGPFIAGFVLWCVFVASVVTWQEPLRRLLGDLHAGFGG